MLTLHISERMKVTFSFVIEIIVFYVDIKEIRIVCLLIKIYLNLCN